MLTGICLSLTPADQDEDQDPVEDEDGDEDGDDDDDDHDDGHDDDHDERVWMTHLRILILTLTSAAVVSSFSSSLYSTAVP